MYSSDEDNTKRTSTGQYKFEITNHLVKKTILQTSKLQKMLRLHQFRCIR